VRVEKLFVRVTECSVKAHELNQLKNSQNTWMYSTRVVYQHCA